MELRIQSKEPNPKPLQNQKVKLINQREKTRRNDSFIHEQFIL
jgi:hypothetical protein